MTVKLAKTNVCSDRAFDDVGDLDLQSIESLIAAVGIVRTHRSRSHQHRVLFALCVSEIDVKTNDCCLGVGACQSGPVGLHPHAAVRRQRRRPLGCPRHAHPPSLVSAAAWLIYPVADMQFGNTSYTERGNGPGLMKAGMMWFWEQFLGSIEPTDDPRAVLMRQVWTSKSPPTVVSVAWHDPLHDEGVDYAALLEKAGGQVTLHTAPDMAHGYLRQCWVNDSARGHLLAAIESVRVLLRS